jgi:hypothetical protein
MADLAAAPSRAVQAAAPLWLEVQAAAAPEAAAEEEAGPVKQAASHPPAQPAVRLAWTGTSAMVAKGETATVPQARARAAAAVAAAEAA